jgi:putative transposon-encoded protein
MRIVKLKKGNFTMEDEVIGFLEKRVTKFGTGAKIDCPKEYLGRRVYVLVLKDEQWESEKNSSIIPLSVHSGQN